MKLEDMTAPDLRALVRRQEAELAEARAEPPSDSSMPVDMSQAKRWVVQLRARIEHLLGVINDRAAQSAPSAAPTASQCALVPNWAGEFTSYQHWVNKAQNWLKSPSHRPSICVDAKGRRCAIGADFMRARDENAFPVRYFWDCEPQAADAPAQAAAPDTVAPAILEALSWHGRERDDLTLEEAVKAFRFGYKEVRQRDDRAMLGQIIELLAGGPASAAAAPDAQPDLHAAIMNLPAGKALAAYLSSPCCRFAYKEGHRDARHAAAELAAAQPEAKAAPAKAEAPLSRMKLYRFDVLDQRGTVLAEGIGVHATGMQEAEGKARKMLGQGESSIKFKSNAPCHPARKCAICDARPDLTGATVFANDGAERDWKAHEAAELATPAPAMGEELPPLPRHPAAVNRIIWTALEEQAIRAYGRACMALRQPGAVANGELEDPVIVPRGLLGAACHAITSKKDAPNTLAKLREFIWAKSAQRATAPVSQPAGQEPIYMAVGKRGGWVDCNKEVYDNMADWNRRIIYTAPQPITAPAPATLSDEQIDVMINNVLRPSGTKLANYTMQKSKDDMRAAMRSALAAAGNSQGLDTCKWTHDEPEYSWDSACGEKWSFIDGGPEDNRVRFCQGCGKSVELAPSTPVGGSHE